MDDTILSASSTQLLRKDFTSTSWKSAISGSIADTSALIPSIFSSVLSLSAVLTPEPPSIKKSALSPRLPYPIFQDKTVKSSPTESVSCPFPSVSIDSSSAGLYSVTVSTTTSKTTRSRTARIIPSSPLTTFFQSGLFFSCIILFDIKCPPVLLFLFYSIHFKASGNSRILFK